MKAMLFAAGLGTRLRPLTNDRPKALVKVHGKTLLQHAVEHLKSFGIIDIVINIHHFGEKVLKELEVHQNFGCCISISDERAALLETGGGLLKAKAHFEEEEAVVIYNVDVLSNINLSTMLRHHQQHEALATLATRNRESSRYLLFNEQQELCGWTNTKTKAIRHVRPAQKIQSYAFSGIHIIRPSLLNLMTQKGKFSIIETYLNLADKHKIIAYPHNQDYWFDVGKPERLRAALEFLD
ncbi:nucleotidyltransferase family protein [Aureispira sp. CCB-QB1]|uniref:nucleotidyltransferase family protein n=1 Tax=Aureispira sp. CCB-QB1 TaxID=1313421 RepID=UPI0006963140|nr:nucleotidyltransferase family protein [Aureispira sp. CCB-QB1]